LRALILGIILIGLAALYATRLEYAPIYLAHDEVLNAINGHSIATTGRDPNGRLLPLYIYIAGDYWATPIVTYVTAGLLKVLPVSEVTIRLASVAVGLISVLLMYVVARQLFKRDWLALIAAAMLALTPAHFIHSRLAVDHLYPVPFVLGWLWCLARFLEHGRQRTLFAGTLLLGIGAYTYLASLMLMPVYLLITAAALFKSGHRSPRTYLVAGAGLALPMALLVPWYIAHPTHFTNQVNMYSVYDASRLNPLQGALRLLGYQSLTARISVYYDGFNPSMLFFSGGSSIINATRQSGVFLLPLAVFLPLGLYRAATGGMTPLNLVLLLGFFTAPIGPAVVNQMMVNRMLVLLPFAVLLATLGVEYFFVGGRTARRAVGVLLLVVLPVQFAFFYRDYMGDYRIRSTVWFERNIRGMIEETVAQDRRALIPAVYLSTEEIPWIDYYWKFYLLKYQREDLQTRTVYFSPGDFAPDRVPEGAVVVSNADSALQKRLETSGLFERRTVITEPNASPSFTIFARMKAAERGALPSAGPLLPQ
jgi:4-amino-4-deoxy-L-arabinose transferase-like glycosyltransferase